jgi:hypothetical protein
MECDWARISWAPVAAAQARAASPPLVLAQLRFEPRLLPYPFEFPALDSQDTPGRAASDRIQLAFESAHKRGNRSGGPSFIAEQGPLRPASNFMDARISGPCRSTVILGSGDRSRIELTLSGYSVSWSAPNAMQRQSALRSPDTGQGTFSTTISQTSRPLPSSTALAL